MFQKDFIRRGAWRLPLAAATCISGIGVAIPVLAVTGGTAGAQDSGYTATTSYVPDAVGTSGGPSVATITDGTSAAPWNTSQGDSGSTSYASQSPGTVLPTYTPGGATTGSGTTAEPNLAVYPAADSSTDGDSPYPSGTAGTPGPLDGYCGSGNQATESSGTPSRQPAGTTLPFSPAYFPHVVRNADGSLTGYFDERPKDADESIVAATSTDNGKDWTYDGQALEQNPGYCPSSDVNDDGEGHPFTMTVDGKTYLYTMERAAGDNAGVGLLVHQLDPTATDPLNGAPAVEKTGVDPDDFASTGVTLGSGAQTISLSEPVGTGPEALVAGPFVDLTATPTPGQSAIIDCTGVGTQSLTGCTTQSGGTITVSPGDLIEQVLATVKTAATVPAGPNASSGDGGLSSLSLTVTNSNNLDLATLNLDAPTRAYVDGTAVYCSQANAYPTTKIEDCTTGSGGSSLSANIGDPVTSDPIVPATAQQTTGLTAPDGIVGVLPSYPGAPAGSTVVLYTEKILNYFIIGDTTNSSSANFSSTINYQSYPNSESAQLPSSGSFNVTIGDNTSGQLVTLTCTGHTSTQLTGCTGGNTSDKYSSNSFIALSSGCATSPSTLSQIGEGSTSSKKLFGNNEDLTVLQAAYTYNGIDFDPVAEGGSSVLANDGVISGNNTSGSAYDDITNPDLTASPSNLNAYGTAGTADATEMRFIGSGGSIITNPNGTYGMFLSGSWCGDGDSDAFNQIFYTESSDGEHWSVPTSVESTDYTFSASAAQDKALADGEDQPLGVSAYYSGRAYGPSVVQNPDGTLTMIFAGYRLPTPVATAGTTVGTDTSDQYTVGTTDPALYRDIMAVTLTSSSSSPVATQTSVSASPSDPVAGQQVTYTATVSVPSPGTGTPTGTIDFTDGADTLCGSASLSDSSPDTATCTTTYDQSEGDTVTATYSGDSNYASSSGQTAVSVGTASTTTSLASNADPSVNGQPVTFTATVSANSPSTGTPTGTVTFALSDPAPTKGKGAMPALSCGGGSDTVSLSGGSATCAVGSLAVSQSPVTVTAAYNGSAGYAAGSPATLSQTVDPGSTAVTLTSPSADPSAWGATVAFTATVTPVAPATGTVSGTVQFAIVGTDGSTAQCSHDTTTVNVSTKTDMATCHVPAGSLTSAASPYQVTATYSSTDPGLAGSTGSSSQAVSPERSVTKLRVPDRPAAGTPVVVTASVTAKAASGTPTGSVTFAFAAAGSGSTPQCDGGDTVELGSGTATCSLSGGLASDGSPYTVTATYSGDANHAASTSSTDRITVSKATASTS